MKTEILTMLRKADGYVSGQEICEHFGVSRTAVWKVINQLKQEGYEIDSVSRKGYCLKVTPDILSKSELESRLKNKWLGKEVIYIEETTSTNHLAKQLAEEKAPEGTLVVADMQTAGKGRRGRVWKQSPHTMISMSFLLRPTFEVEKASRLSVLVGHSVAKGIKEVTGLSVELKWPNDIVYHKKKICGILNELSLEQTEIQYIVVGIGINVNVSEFPDDLRDMASSLMLECGREISRCELIEAVLRNFENDYEQFLETEDLRGIVDSYNNHLAGKDDVVRVLDPKGEYQGISRGIDPEGELLVERNDGEIVKVYAGEVSVRGLYGYV